MRRMEKIMQRKEDRIKNKEILVLIEKKHETSCENCRHCNLRAYYGGKWYCRKISVFQANVDFEKCFERKEEQKT